MAQLSRLDLEEGTFTGTQHGILRGAGRDLPPTGRHVRIPYIQVVRFRAGKQTAFSLVFDRLLMLEQLGIARGPGYGAGYSSPGRSRSPAWGSPG